MHSDGTPQEPRTPRRQALVAALAVALLWSVALVPGGPSFDDLEGVAANPLVNGERAPVDALTTDYWNHRGDAGHLRPLAIWSLALDHRLFGNWWPGFHLTGVLLHAAVVGLGALLLLRLALEAVELGGREDGRGLLPLPERRGLGLRPLLRRRCLLGGWRRSRRHSLPRSRLLRRRLLRCRLLGRRSGRGLGR